MVSTASLRPPALPTRSRTTDEIPRSTAARPHVAPAARIPGRADPRLDGILRAPRRRGGDRLSGRRARLGGEAVSASRSYDIVIIGSGAGGGTVAQELAPLVRDGVRILVLEKGPRFADQEFTGRELEMADALYQDGGAFLTRDGTMTLAFASAYGGSTVVYTGTSLTAPLRVIRAWGVPGLEHADLTRRSAKYAEQNNVHALDDPLINDNNRLFVEGGRKAGYLVEQFPVNVKGCRGSSLCNLGCPNQAKQGTNRVQLPRAERAGVEVVTRAEVLRIGADQTLDVRVVAKPAGAKGAPPEWPPGEHRVRAGLVVCAAGENGITVDGAGRPVVHYRLMPDTIDGLVRGTRAAARILFAAGARRVHAPAEPPLIDAAEAGRIEQRITARHFRPGTMALSAAHLMGGCAMGRSAADSVTDAWGRVHGIPWLRVADASLFPDSLEINPYVTIMALADRVAEAVRADA